MGRAKVQVKNDGGVHLAHPIMEQTICGESNEGWGKIYADWTDPETAEITAWQTTDEPVNCRHCLAIIATCVEYHRTHQQ